ncbi:hypothetical protein VTK73DRAFT_5527 [Phialemonium thermophilum]|uniref:Uncharacterized protein n=1 Tax=Phialemonium thermophilum TaxID=223376 RepID=A0ABR3V1C9_9PEZI
MPWASARIRTKSWPPPSPCTLPSAPPFRPAWKLWVPRNVHSPGAGTGGGRGRKAKIGLSNPLVRILLGKHAQGLHRKEKLVVGIADHGALVEDALDRLLPPLPVGLLPFHDQPDAPLDALHVRVVRLHEPDERPGGHDHLRTRRVFQALRLPKDT